MFEIPEKLSALTAEELQAAMSGASARFAELNKIDENALTTEQADEIIALGDFKVAASAEFTAREEKAQRLAAARQAFTTEADDLNRDDNEDNNDPQQVAGADDADNDADADEDAGEDGDNSRTASGRRSPAAGAARRKREDNRDQKPARPMPSLTAAADVPGIPNGHKFESLTAAGAAIKARLNAGGHLNQPARNGALVIELPQNPLNDDDYPRIDELLFAASQESRLEGGSLSLSAAGWAAPSDTLLTFCGIETTEGLINIPEVTITRGGQQYTKGPTLESVEASATGFWDMTEAEAEAETVTKTALEPEAPPFTEVRLDAIGTMVEAGLLTRAAWPELIDRYVKLALLVHERRISRKVLTAIEAYTGAAVSVPNGFGNALDVLHVLDVVMAGERERNGMGRNQTLEVILPHWVINVIRADLANRNGVDFLSVTDAQIQGYFTARRARVQWLYGYQPLVKDASGITTTYPDTVEMLIYPAGTYVKGVAPVLTLDTVYDSVNLKKNKYVHLFTEQGIAVTNPCNEGRRVSLPLVANGRTAANDITGDLFNAAPAV